MPEEIDKLISECKVLFGKNRRPAVFTNDPCCGEGAEYDAMFRMHTPDSIGLRELGNSGLDPIFYITPEAYRYYFPALARLAVDNIASGNFLDLFLFHLRLDGYQNRFLKTFSEVERCFVARFLQALNRHYGEIIEERHNPFELEATMKLWDATR